MSSNLHLINENDEYDVDDAAEIKKKFDDVIDKRFSLSDNGEPAFTVIADNKTQSQLIIIPYPQDISRQLFDDEGNNLTQQGLIDELDAYQISVRSPIIRAVLSETDGWKSTESHRSTIRAEIERLKVLGLDVFPNMLLMSRSLELLKRPKVASTRSAIEAGKKFECILQPREVVNSIFDMRDLKKLREPEWRLNAACYYEYANSLKGALMSGLVMGALAWLAASETGPFSFGAFIAAGSVGATSHDIVMRIPVIAWSAANGKTKFLAANVCYIIIVIIFESLAHFKEAKGILKAGEVVGVKNAASASSNIIAKKIAEKLESVPNMSRLAKDELGAIIDGIFSHAYDANDVKVSEKFFENALSAAERLDFWTPTKLWIVGMALQFISAQFGESVAEQCRAELEEMANNDFNLDVLETSKSELMSDIDALSAKYPPI